MNTPFDPVAARAALPPLDWQRPAPAAGELVAYARHYGLDRIAADAGVAHGLGRVEAAGFRIAVQCWRHAPAPASAPASSPRGTVLVLHGYYDHVGIFGHVIAHVLGLGYDVVACDLPGHGLSSGAPAVIDDFATYQQVLQVLLAGMQGAALPRPWRVVAQSTGGGIVLEFLLSGRHDAASAPFDRAVLLAPLVRPVNWGLNRIVYHLVRPFRAAIPRKFAVNSHDGDFLRFLHAEDPLQARELSTRWVGAMREWFPRVERAVPCEYPLLVVQGDDDHTVDWRYNLGVIRAKFPQAEIAMIAGGRHQLANEAPPWRDQVFAAITRTFS